MLAIQHSSPAQASVIIIFGPFCDRFRNPKLHMDLYVSLVRGARVLSAMEKYLRQSVTEPLGKLQCTGKQPRMVVSDTSSLTVPPFTSELTMIYADNRYTV